MACYRAVCLLKQLITTQGKPENLQMLGSTAVHKSAGETQQVAQHLDLHRAVRLRGPEADGMRRCVRAALLCLAFASLLALYVLNEMAEAEAVRRRLPARDRRRRGREVGPRTRYEIGRPNSTGSLENSSGRMHLAVVACGERLEETLTMMKSAVLFSHKPLNFHIFAEDELHDKFNSSLENWKKELHQKFNHTIYPITFPADTAALWKKLFKPCASQRLFLPLILKDVDSLLYVDTDVLFLSPIDDIWAFFEDFNQTQIAGMAPEHDEPRIGWYNRFARHPYYGKTGVNSGVMLMNMSRIRKKYFKNDMTTARLKWEDLLLPLFKKYKLNITWGDQDLLNIVFYYNPESLFIFPCQWNYRPDHCMYGSNCKAAEDEGIFVLHGNRGVYHDEKQPAFRAVYRAIKNYPFGEDPIHSLLDPLEKELQKTTNTYCGKIYQVFTQRLQKSIRILQQNISQGR